MHMETCQLTVSCHVTRQLARQTRGPFDRGVHRVNTGMNVQYSLCLIYKVNFGLSPFTGIRCGRVVSVGESRHYGHGGVPLGKTHFLA